MADILVLGSYFSPAQDVVPAMTSKFLEAGGEVVPWSTLRALTIEER